MNVCYSRVITQLFISVGSTTTTKTLVSGGSWWLVSEVWSLVTPLVVVLLLVLLVVLCTLVMVADYLVKGARYTKWKNQPPSRLHSPDHGATYSGPRDGPYSSLSTISEYIPLCAENRESELQVDGPVVSLVKRRRRRLLKRRETLSDWCLNSKRSEHRKSSLPVRIRLNRSVSARDCSETPTLHITPVVEKRSKQASRSQRPKKQRDSARSSTSATTISSARSAKSRPVSESERPGSDMTLRPAHSVSGFSCTSTEQELEYDLYDCDIGNVMSVPGSMFAPAYWDVDTTPTLDLELTQLFPSEDGGEVEMRETGGRGQQQVTSVTSDLTSSISSAVSRSTLVGDEPEMGGELETSCYYGGGVAEKSGELETSCYYSGDEEEPCLRSHQAEQNNKLLMNITHIDDISFVDD